MPLREQRDPALPLRVPPGEWAGSTLVAAEFDDIVAQVTKGPLEGFVGMEFV